MPKPVKVLPDTTTAVEEFEMNAKENAQILDPNRFKIAKNMAVLPGGAENNNPMNVTGIADAPITAPSIYGDFQQAYPQMGSGMVNPTNVPNSGLPQLHPLGQGFNAAAPYNLQQQPKPEFEEMLEGGRLGFEAKQRGLFTAPYMGMIGESAKVAPGGVVPSPQQSANTMPLAGMSTQMMPPPGGMNMKSGKRG